MTEDKSLKAISIIGGGSKENRSDNDFYPTPPEVTKALMNFLSLKPSRILEPASGDGSMSKVMESYGHTVTSCDLRREGVYGIGGVNFLTEAFEKHDAVITNPPFNIAEEFIKKSLTLAPLVAMVLKSQYWHASGRTPLFSKHSPAWILPLTWRPDFDGRGAPTMDVIWTVWIRGSQTMPPKYLPLVRPYDNELQYKLPF